MSNEDDTMEELRPSKSKTRSYMSAADLNLIRTRVLRTTLKLLAEQLIKPDTGKSLTTSALCRYVNGSRPIPQWVAEQVLLLAEAAKAYDARR